jgi:hypothetical protein
MAVVFPAPFAPRKKFLLYRPQRNVVNSGKAAKFLAEVSYFYDSFSFQREGVLSGTIWFS